MKDCIRVRLGDRVRHGDGVRDRGRARDRDGELGRTSRCAFVKEPVKDCI